MARASDDDLNRDAGKKVGKTLDAVPGRAASLPEVREWLSKAAGLPPEVRIDAIVRAGPDPEDPLTMLLSNEMKLRCNHQSRLQQPKTLQAWLVSSTDGLAQPAYLSPAEVGAFYGQLCRLSSPAAKPDPVADLAEYLDDYLRLCEELHGSLFPDGRYVTIETLKVRAPFNRTIALGMRNGRAEAPPALLVDTKDDRRYVRASEWVTYLRFVVGWTVNGSQLKARMAELGSEHIDPQAWNDDRSRKVHLVFYSVPAEL